MADVKWIKIVVDIFDDDKIKLIEALPEGDSIIVCWFKLLCLAGQKNNLGVMMLNDRIAYTDEMLATIFRRKLQTVKLALETFELFGMIEILDGCITIPNWGKHQSLEGMEKVREQTRERVSRYRERQKLLTGVTVCQYCGNEATGEDHIIALARGGSDDPENKVPCCIRCNRIKNDKPLVDFLNNNLEIIDKETVANNPKLSKLVTFRNVTGRYEITQRNDIDIEKEKNKKKNKSKKSIFVPPTLEEVAAYVKERGNSVNPQKFLDYYAANDWKDQKGEPVHNWKQKMIAVWEKDEPKKKKQYTTSADYKTPKMSREQYEENLRQIQKAFPEVGR